MSKQSKKPVLVLENIHKSYSGMEVLKGISLSANQGDVISILGSSGSGKSTLLRCINFLEMPDSGKVSLSDFCIDAAAVDKKAVQAMRAELGMVFQGFNLWSHMTVLENVMEGPLQVLKRSKQEVESEALVCLEKVGIADKCDSYPEQLSGGQKQRVAIARALAMRPKVLLFDEPTSALDPELVNEILLVIRELAAEGRTMIIVTHEMRFAREVSDHIVFLHDGLIEDQGTPTHIFENSPSTRVRDFLASV
jgi:ABC-type histidine transport system ATPase subunit